MKKGITLHPVRGRGTDRNPANRFERLHIEFELDEQAQQGPFHTQFLEDTSRTILSRNNSPDVGFDFSINPYRGCEHGCIYCYARPSHEYLGFSAGLDFESKILVKRTAPRLLREQLLHASWVPEPVALSGVTDPYQPVERKLGLTRACLKVLLEFRNPVLVVTKNHLVSRDLDLLKRLSHFRAAAVHFSLTSLDPELHKKMEPRTSSPTRRLEAIQKVSAQGVPVRVLLAPIIPGLNDSEIPALLAATARAGARSAGYAIVRLPHGVKNLFVDWLDAHFPQRSRRVLNRIREVRGGSLNETRFFRRMRAQGTYAEHIHQLFVSGCRKHDLLREPPQLSASSFRRPNDAEQMFLFEGTMGQQAGLFPD